MSTKEQTIEQVLGDALRRHDNGEPAISIVAAYPDSKNEIEEMFSSVSFLEAERERILVPRAGLAKLLHELSTQKEIAPEREAKRRSFSPWRIFIPVMAVILLAVVGIVLRHPAGNNTPKTTGVSLTDSSDAALDQDVASIDAQMSGLASDESNTDQSLGSMYQ